jgi:signal transduction histidine kinase
LLGLVETAIEAHQRRTDRHQIRLVGCADPLGLWDAACVARVPENLLSNAIKYSPDGGEISSEVVEEDDCNSTRMAAVRVRDYGVGIPVTDGDLGRNSIQRAQNGNSNSA